jgi:ArsR family transcriptional regulator, arsenate/arsenite/antimonite-responsive transcriptional repressor
VESAEHIFRALSDHTRLRILHFLRGGELCVGDLVRLLEVPQPTASRHLNYLRKTGLVSARRAGLWGFYSLCDAPTEFHRLLLNCLDHCGDLEPPLKRGRGAKESPFQADSRKVAALRKSGGCCPDLHHELTGKESGGGRKVAGPRSGKSAGVDTSSKVNKGTRAKAGAAQ